MAENSNRNERWKTLNHLTKQLFEGEVELEELVSQQQSDNIPQADDALDHGFLKKRKRSPRNNNNIPEKKPTNGLKIIIKNPNPRKNPSSACFEVGESSVVASNYKLLMKKQIINNNNEHHSTSTTRPLPEALERRIAESGGRVESAVVLIEKELYPTDLSTKHCRMSVPIRQVKERFLLPEEVEFLSSGGKIRTWIVSLEEECEISFSVWKSNTTYVLMSGWKDVWIKNRLRDWMHVRLWAFRRDSHLCFALETM